MREHTTTSARDQGGHEWLPLDTLRDTFALLVTGPNPVSVDGRRFPGLPGRPIPLDELRDRLLSDGCSPRTRDTVWRYLVRRARTEGGTWTVACAGMALPGLAGSARRLAAHYRGDRADAHAALLTGFLQALASVDLERPAIARRLRWAAFRAGHAAVAESLDAPVPVAAQDLWVEVDALPPVVPGFRSSCPRRLWGHADLVLARAVAEGVLTPTEAELIGTTRLEEVSLAEWARRHAVSYRRANLARWRAERRLVAYLLEGAVDADTPDPVEAEALARLALRPTTPPPASPSSSSSPLRTVSGRGRNGRPAAEKKSSRSVKENATESGLLPWRDTTPTTRSASIREARRCA